MRRVLWFALLFVVLLGVLAGPIVADAKPEAPRGVAPSCSLVGEVIAVDPAKGTIAVSVLSGNALVKQFIGQEIPLVTGATTRFWPPDITLETLAVGSVIRSTGTCADSVLAAAVISVLSRPMRFELRGEVTEVREPVISVRVRDGSPLVKPYIGKSPLPLMTDIHTQFSPKGTSLGSIVSGSAIVASGIYTESQFLAQRIILVQEHKPKPFELVGVVVVVAGLPNTLSVRVLKGNAVVKPYFGEKISIGVTANTRYLPPTTKLADLMGVQVKVQGMYAESVFVGQKITVTSARPKGIAGREPKASKDPKADDPGGDEAGDKGKGNGAGNSGAAQAPRGKSAPGRTKQKK